MFVRNFVPVTIFFLAVAACGKLSGTAVSPVTEQVAAKAAATCFNWPKGVRRQASRLSRTNEFAEAGIDMEIHQAKKVTVDSRGGCSKVDETSLITGVMYSIPPSSFTMKFENSEKVFYVLFLTNVNTETGERDFVGMRMNLQYVSTVRPIKFV